MKKKIKLMKIATWFKVGENAGRNVRPKNGRKFSYKELQDFVRDDEMGAMVEIVPMPSGMLMVVNEEGKLRSEPLPNELATKLWKLEYPISKYPNNNDELICGNALVCPSSMID